MTKSVDIENCLASSKMQKYFKKNFARFLKKYLKISDFKNIFFQLIKLPLFKYFYIFELPLQFLMSTDFFINFDFKND